MNKYSDLSLTWFGDITSVGEEAQYARAILEPLILGGAKIRLELVNSGIQGAELSQWWHETIAKLTQTQPGFIKINHCNPDKGAPNPIGGPLINLCHWDTLEFPSQWIQSLNNYTEVWSTYDINSVFIPGTSKQSYVVNCPVSDTPDDQTNLVDIKDNAIVFGTVGPWIQKSNMHDLIAAFCVEFSSNDNVVLVVKTGPANGNPDPNQKAQVLNLVRSIKGTINKPNLPPILVIQDNLSELATARLVKRFNIYISAMRGSSVDIPFLHALNNGSLCVVPRVGIYTHMNRLLGTNNRQIRPVNAIREPVVNSPGGNPTDRWTRVDLDHLCKELRMAFIDHQVKDTNLQKKIQNNKDYIKDKLSPGAIGDILFNKLNSLVPYSSSSFKF